MTGGQLTDEVQLRFSVGLFNPKVTILLEHETEYVYAYLPKVSPHDFCLVAPRKSRI